MKLIDINESIERRLYRILIKSRGKNIRVIIRIIPGCRDPIITAYEVKKPIQLPRMLPVEIRELLHIGFVVTKSRHELSYADILLKYDHIV